MLGLFSKKAMILGAPAAGQLLLSLIHIWNNGKTSLKAPRPNWLWGWPLIKSTPWTTMPKMANTSGSSTTIFWNVRFWNCAITRRWPGSPSSATIRCFSRRRKMHSGSARNWKTFRNWWSRQNNQESQENDQKVHRGKASVFFVCLTEYGFVLMTFNGDRGKQEENGSFPRESDEDFQYL